MAQWKRTVRFFLIAGLAWAGFQSPAHAKVRVKHPDQLLFERAECVADFGKFGVANLAFQTLINTYPKSKYAKKAKIALQDPRIARCGQSWNPPPSCDVREAATAAQDATSAPDQCDVTRLRSALGIQPGMRRSDLLEIFTIEGGLSNRLRQTFVLKSCEIVHVDVTFSPISNETDHLAELPDDKISTISNPYLGAMHFD